MILTIKLLICSFAQIIIKKHSKSFASLKNSTTFAPVKRNTIRNFRASEWESLLSRNEHSRKCRVAQKRGNSSVGRAQPCRKIIRFTTLASICDTKKQIRRNAEIAQLVEHNLAKVGVASSSLVFRSKSPKQKGQSNEKPL